MSGPERNAAAVEALDEITRRLRRECPWDREQDERSIVPHTVEEAYELADAAARHDDGSIVDELGDVLFQVHFLSLLLEERGAGDMASVADHCREKLIRRHPHVFGAQEQTGGQHGEHHPPAADAQRGASDANDLSRAPSEQSRRAESDSVQTSDDVLAQWDRIKREQEGCGAAGLFAGLPENLPALLYARKLQRRALTAAGEEVDPADAARALREAADDLSGLLEQGESAAPSADPAQRQRVTVALGELLFTAVDVARRMHADPELALRSQAGRFRELRDSDER